MALCFRYFWYFWYGFVCSFAFRLGSPVGGVSPVGGKGYKEQERGQEAFVSLWCKLGIAWRAFSHRSWRTLARWRAEGELEPAGKLLCICVPALAWQKQWERQPELRSLGSRLTRGWACARRFGCAHVRHA